MIRIRWSWVLPAVALAAIGLLTACSGSDSVTSGGKGQLRVQLTSTSGTVTAAEFAANLEREAATAPASPLDGSRDDDDGQAPRLAAVNVTFSAILARNLQGELVPVQMALPVVVDVLALAGGPAVSLPVGLLPPGDYDQLVVNMTAVQLVTQDDLRITIEPPGGGWTAIVPVDPFTVIEGESTDLTLRLRLDRAFHFLGDEIEFDPEFECEKD